MRIWYAGFREVSHDMFKAFLWVTFRAVPETADVLKLHVGGRYTSSKSEQRCTNGLADHLRGTDGRNYFG